MSLLGEVGFLAQNERVWKTLGGLSKNKGEMRTRDIRILLGRR